MRARGAHLPVRGARLALLVDAGGHDRRAELGGQAQEPVEARAGSLALFEVDRVEDRLAAEPRERGARDGGLGGVDHDRHRGLGGQAAHHLVHVRDAVGAGVVDAHVEQVGALLDLVAPDAHAGVPVPVEHRLAELLGSVGVGSLADQQDRRVLAVRGGGVDGRDGGLEHGRARRGRHRAHARHDLGEVGRRRPAAAPRRRAPRTRRRSGPGARRGRPGSGRSASCRPPRWAGPRWACTPAASARTR